jgi:hypothetical protein
MYDLFVLVLLILMVLFITYNFYTDYTDWSNTGNTFAEGMAAQQIIININTPKPSWEEFKNKMSSQTDITYKVNNTQSQMSHLSISGYSAISKMIPVTDEKDKLFSGAGAALNTGDRVYLYRKTYELSDFPWRKYAIVINKPSWEQFAKALLKEDGVQAAGGEFGAKLQISNKSSFSKILPIIKGKDNFRKIFVSPSTWEIQDKVELYQKTYMLSAFNWIKFPVAPASTWSSGGRCPAGCKKPVCVSGNCKEVKIVGKDFKSCSGTCNSLNQDDKPNVCKSDDQCTPELCGEQYYPMDDETPCTSAQKQWSNQAWDKEIGKDLDPIDVNRSICPGIGGPYGCGPIEEKDTARKIFSEKDMKSVLANRNLIPIGINIRVDNPEAFIRIGKNLMNDVSYMRNVAVPNISDNDYETLGRVIGKLQTDSGAQNEVTTLKLTNSINNILIGKPLSNSQLDWGYEIPKSIQTTGMYGDNSNAMMSRSERDAKFRDDIKKKAKLPDGGLCMWSGCERLGKSPYDSIWNLY